LFPCSRQDFSASNIEKIWPLWIRNLFVFIVLNASSCRWTLVGQRHWASQQRRGRTLRRQRCSPTRWEHGLENTLNRSGGSVPATKGSSEPCVHFRKPCRCELTVSKLMLRASLGKVVHTVRRARTYAAKGPPHELHKIAVRERAMGGNSRLFTQLQTRFSASYSSNIRPLGIINFVIFIVRDAISFCSTLVGQIVLKIWPQILSAVRLSFWVRLR
jgi:hypothetical protein